MTRISRRIKALVGVTAVLASSLAGCGLELNAALPFKVLPGTIQPKDGLQGLPITVGSKDFTENILLAYMAELGLSAAGADVTDMSDIKGSVSARQALIAGQIDITWEYTGTGWINYQGNTDPIPDEREQFEAVKKADAQQYGIDWLQYSPLNNTYAFGTTAAFAEKNNLKTNSDMTAFLKEHPEQGTFCVETEFASRQDGMPGVQKTYGFTPAEIKTFGIGTIYSSIANGTCNFGEIFTTDGRIAGLNLSVLADDKKFFPQYNVAPTLRSQFVKDHPQVREVLEPIAAAIDNNQMIELGKQVDIEGRDPGEVARDWMVSKGLVKMG